MKKLALLLGIFLLSPVVLAQKLELLSLDINLNNTLASHKAYILFSKPPKGNFTWPLPFLIKNFRSSATIKKFRCRAEKKAWGAAIYCKFEADEGRSLTLKFCSQNIKKLNQSKWLFRSSVNVPLATKKLVARIWLSEGLVLTNGALQPYSPQDGKKGSGGRRIFVTWIRKGLNESQGFPFHIQYESVSFPEKSRQEANVLYIMIGFLGLLAISIFILRKRPEQFLPVLKEDERKVFELIREESSKRISGECKQKVLAKHMDFSKAKISRLVKDLEERGLLRKRKVGRTNRLSIMQK